MKQINKLIKNINHNMKKKTASFSPEGWEEIDLIKILNLMVCLHYFVKPEIHVSRKKYPIRKYHLPITAVPNLSLPSQECNCDRWWFIDSWLCWHCRVSKNQGLQSFIGPWRKALMTIYFSIILTFSINIKKKKLNHDGSHMIFPGSYFFYFPS